LTISTREYTKHCYCCFYVCYQNPEKPLNSYGERKQNSGDFPLKFAPLILATILLPVALTSSHDASITADLPLASSFPYSLSHCIHWCQLCSDLQ